MHRIIKFLGAFLLSALLAVSVAGQELPKPDAPRVLALTVGYGTAKASRWSTLTPETKTEIEGLERAYAAANSARHYDEAMKIVHHAQAVVMGAKYTPLRALASDIVMRADHALFEPFQKVQLRIGEWYPLDEVPAEKLAAQVLLSKQGSDASGSPLKTLEVNPADLGKEPLTVSVLVPDVADGNYSLSVVLKPANAGEADFPIRTSVNIRMARGLTAKMMALRTRLQKLKDPDPSAEYRVSLYDLVYAGEVPPGRIDFDAEFKEANAVLDAADKKGDPWAARKGDLHKAYRSAVDNTLQPYRVFIPSSYDGTKNYPLIIALHGMGGDENSYFDQYQQGLFKTLAEQHGYLVACPKGRQSASMYVGTAEKDVMDVLAEMRRVYKVDGSRIYLTGHSMGGYGTWSLAMGHPDLFAALAPISGGGNAAGMIRLKNIPQIVIHGDADNTVSVEKSREMVEAGKKAGAEIKYIEVKGGSHVSVAAPAFPDIFDFFDAHPAKAGG
jgi:predicted esterase